MTLKSLGIIRPKDMPDVEVDPRRASRSPTRPTASRASARSAWCRRPARWPPPCTRSTAVAHGAADAARHRRRRPMTAATSDGATTPGPGLRPPPPLLGAGPGHARRRRRRRPTFRRDPRVDLVAARRRPRPRDHRLVGPARRARGARERLHRDHRPPRVAQRHRGQPRRHRRRLRRGRGAGVVRLRRDRPPRARRGQGRPGRERALPAGRRRAGLVGVHAAFTCTDETLEAAAGLAARPRRRACTSTWPRPTPTTAPPSGWPGSPTTAGCSSTACTWPTTTACPARSCTTRGRT